MMELFGKLHKDNFSLLIFDVILLFRILHLGSNRFDFMNHQEEFETIECGNPKHILPEFSNIFLSKYT